jgi:hypothetical protein
LFKRFASEHRHSFSSKPATAFSLTGDSIQRVSISVSTLAPSNSPTVIWAVSYTATAS